MNTHYFDCPYCHARCKLIQFGYGWIAICAEHGVVYNSVELPE